MTKIKNAKEYITDKYNLNTNAKDYARQWTQRHDLEAQLHNETQSLIQNSIQQIMNQLIETRKSIDLQANENSSLSISLEEYTDDFQRVRFTKHHYDVDVYYDMEYTRK
jgi:hypothetical protein